VHLATRVGIVLFGLAAFAGRFRPAAAQDTIERVFVCPPVPQEIVVNGELDEWDKTKALELKDEKRQFVRRDPS